MVVATLHEAAWLWISYRIQSRSYSSGPERRGSIIPGLRVTECSRDSDFDARLRQTMNIIPGLRVIERGQGRAA